MFHKAHKCGDHWLKIPEFEHRASCPECGVEESMTHILMECDIPGQKEVWDLAKQLWLKKHSYWPDVKSIDNIIGCSLMRFTTRNNRWDPGTSRLYRIIISESAHLIWKLRCNRVVGTDNSPEQWSSQQEIENKWLSAINRRLTLDRAMTKSCYGSKALQDNTVLDTWSGTLYQEESLPNNWLRKSGVLVGIIPPERPWRQDPP